MSWGFKVLTHEDFRNGMWKTIDKYFGSTKGSIPVVSGLSVTEMSGRTILTFSNVAVPTVDATTSGAGGGLKIYNFPEGLLEYRGAVANVVLTAQTGITATSAVVSGLGTVTANADATLTSTEQDLLPSTATTLTASSAPFAAVSTTSQLQIVDGTAAAKGVYLNFAMPDAGSTANSSILVSGTITISWSFIADK